MNLTLLACTSFFFAFCAPAYAASVTVTDPNCGSYAITGSGGDLSLTCAGAPLPPPNPPSGWNGTCPGFTKTLNVDQPWVSTTGATRILTSNYGGFGANDALVIQLHPPLGAMSTANGSIALYEWGGGPITRLTVISTTPCDFSLANAPTLFNASKGSDPRFFYQVGGAQPNGYVLMRGGVTYYVNVKNTGCPAGTTCNMGSDFTTAPGT